MVLPTRIGRYEVELLLGEGGVGRVLLARDPVVRRQVAIKVVRDDLGLTPAQHGELTERVRQGARAAGTLAHPGMVVLHDMGDDLALGLYLVFELVRGPTLRERMQEGPLSPEEGAKIARALGSALTHAHSAGLAHRGVRPENIMLTPSGPKLTDLGVCQGNSGMTPYAAPELLASGAFSPHSDQFALASTMCEALTIRRALPGGDSEAVGARVATSKKGALRSVQPALRGFLRLDAIFSRALAREPTRRFPSCEAFGSALATELTGSRVTFLATPGPARSSLPRATRRWQNGVALIAVAVILSLIVIGRLRHPASADDKTGAPMQRVAPASQPHPGRPSPFIAPPASATSFASPTASRAGGLVDP